MTPISKRIHSENGFTLVELAIVLMIIGLLIGGVLRGQELISNAKVTATVRHVTSYSAATNTFRDSYSQLPGDMMGATTRIPNCNASSFCVNGDGNSIIGISSTTTFLMQSGTTSAPRVETSMYWKHLSMARLISGINQNANPSIPNWAETHPAAPIAGGFHIRYFITNPSGIPGTQIGSGHWLILQNRSQGNSPFVGGGAEAISPKLAARIDRKMDDGRGSTGDVVSDDQTGGVGSCENVYNESLETSECIMYFKIF